MHRPGGLEKGKGLQRCGSLSTSLRVVLVILCLTFDRFFCVEATINELGIMRKIRKRRTVACLLWAASIGMLGTLASHSECCADPGDLSTGKVFQSAVLGHPVAANGPLANNVGISEGTSDSTVDGFTSVESVYKLIEQTPQSEDFSAEVSPAKASSKPTSYLQMPQQHTHDFPIAAATSVPADSDGDEVNGWTAASDTLAASVISDTQASGAPALMAASDNLDQPWWLPQVPLPIREGTASLPLDLDTLFALTVAHSGRVNAIKQTPWINQMRVSQARAAFDPTLYNDTRFDSTSDPVGNTLTTGGPSRLEEDIFNYDTGLRGTNLRGTVYQFGQRLGYEDSNSQFFVPRNQGQQPAVREHDQAAAARSSDGCEPYVDFNDAVRDSDGAGCLSGNGHQATE